MSTSSTPAPGPEEERGPRSRRDVDEEFARMLDAEGISPAPSPASGPPSGRAAQGVAPGTSDDAAGSQDVDDDEVLLGDFVPPDPDLPPASDGAVWSWIALIGGVLLALLAAVLDTIPTWAGALGGIAAVGGLVALIARVPPDRSDPTDGAQV